MDIREQVVELVTAIVLDDEIAATAVADSLLIADAVDATELQTLAIARAEAWRQLRARNIFPEDTRLIRAGSDPVAGLTVAERTVLAIAGRLHRTTEEGALILGVQSPRTFYRWRRRARMQLVRSATAIALITQPGRCPVVVAGVGRFGTDLDRGTAMHFVSHAGECSICVEVLRLVDHQVWQEYQEAPAATYLPAAAVGNAADLVARARLAKGWPAREATYRRNSRQWLRWSIAAGALSAALVALALLLA